MSPVLPRLTALALGLCVSVAFAAAEVEIIPVTPETENVVCEECHGVDGFAMPADDPHRERSRELSFDMSAFSESAHGGQRCVACHSDIEQMPHREAIPRAVDCVTCHQETQVDAPYRRRQRGGDETLDTLQTEIAHYMASVHAAPREGDPSRPNATCAECHNAHFVFPIESAQGRSYRITTPAICGSCHEDQKAEYDGSVHGIAVNRFESADSAVCADCHTAHDITPPEGDAARVAITQNCGTCHDDAYESYRETYHGQVSSLGYGHTAKCHDCHGAHGVQPVSLSSSSVHPDNRLETCRQCHESAPVAFAGFYAHGSRDDFARYPEMWIASKLMIALLVGVFAFFWTHSALWFYREWRDREEGKHHVLLDEYGAAVERPEQRVHVRRFGWGWRLAHLVLALAVMTLVLTGTTVMYADSFWAPAVMGLLGGPELAGTLHRVAAVTFAAIFFGHLAVIFYDALVRKRGKVRWFGPYSLLPRWRDFADFAAMVKWFFGYGPRPVFDHWTYFEKFDYWAPFWGMFIIGVSGLMLWFPEATGAVVPGWMFNVATIVHGEEAFLAAVFLFTVHYFNCHFRPDKLPQDIVMFTGSMPLEEFKHERRDEYERLLAEGRLDGVLVDPPSRAMTLGSQVLGFALIAFGLVLLVLVLSGFLDVVVWG